MCMHRCESRTRREVWLLRGILQPYGFKGEGLARVFLLLLPLSFRELKCFYLFCKHHFLMLDCIIQILYNLQKDYLGSRINHTGRTSSWTDSHSRRRLHLRQKQHHHHSQRQPINLTIAEVEAAEAVVEAVVHPEDEAVHLSAVEVVSNSRTIINLATANKILATTNRVMATNSNNIKLLSSTKMLNNTRSRNSISPLSNIKLLLNHM